MQLNYEVLNQLALIATGQIKGNNFDKPGTAIRQNSPNSFSGRYEGKSINGKLDSAATGYVYYEGKRTYYLHGHATNKPQKPSK